MAWLSDAGYCHAARAVQFSCCMACFRGCMACRVLHGVSLLRGPGLDCRSNATKDTARLARLVLHAGRMRSQAPVAGLCGDTCHRTVWSQHWFASILGSGHIHCNVVCTAKLGGRSGVGKYHEACSRQDRIGGSGSCHGLSAAWSSCVMPGTSKVLVGRRCTFEVGQERL